MKTFGSFHFRVNGFVERSNKTGNKQEVPCVVSLVKLIILLSMLCKNRIYAFKKKKRTESVLLSVWALQKLNQKHI